MSGPESPLQGGRLQAGRLQARLLRRIAAEGPLTVAQFMVAALLDPQDGYYTRAAPLGDEAGAGGDFVTAPEVSQVFGELLGLWCLEAWQRLGEPTNFKLIELGPGRGTLMVDLLRSLALLPACRVAAQVHLVEASPRLTAIQRQTLVGQEIAWHRSLAEVPPGPCLLIANELFDALPLRQFEKSPEGWRERLVARDGREGLTFALSGALPARLLPPAATQAPEGAVLEISPAATALAQELGTRLADHPACALILDYGYRQRPWKGSLQAVAGHRRVAPLQSPGRVDLSAQVDFAALAAAAQAAGAESHGPVSQRQLLLALGLAERAASLQQGLSVEAAARVEAACRRLVDPEAMGESFLALALQSPGLETPAGFPLPD
ncbi:MAG: SAM-dependent methyltransferase [Rhodospirillales bacterium]